MICAVFLLKRQSLSSDAVECGSKWDPWLNDSVGLPTTEELGPNSIPLLLQWPEHWNGSDESCYFMWQFNHVLSPCGKLVMLAKYLACLMVVIWISCTYIYVIWISNEVKQLSSKISFSVSISHSVFLSSPILSWYHGSDEWILRSFGNLACISWNWIIVVNLLIAFVFSQVCIYGVDCAKLFLNLVLILARKESVFSELVFWCEIGDLHSVYLGSFPRWFLMDKKNENLLGCYES